MCNKLLWSALSPLLENGFELIYLTIPTGKSMDELADFYNDTLGDDKINLIGFSLGGYIATYFAAKFPKHVRALFIIANSSTLLPSFEIKKREAAVKFIAKGGGLKLKEQQVNRLFDKPADNKQQVDLVMQMIRQQGESELLSQYQHTSDRKDLAEQLNTLSIPMWFYYSEHDPLVNASWFKQLHLKKQLTISSTTGRGHMLPLEKPAELANHIITWAGTY
ncbi:alpha/beta hydrolase [Pseudoalteromonas sp. MMG010]|nr:alpha/beta hydrolase [Pseudoalteromonas sp. MMG010]MBQ4834206.1 alpha/beta hydrolase [Pseudoalteromonas sp. MMG010]